MTAKLNLNETEANLINALRSKDTDGIAIAMGKLLDWASSSDATAPAERQPMPSAAPSRPVKHVDTTHPPEDAREEDYLLGGSVDTQAHNFRLAFAIVGALIADGFIKVNFNECDWQRDFELAVGDVSDVLNNHFA